MFSGFGTLDHRLNGRKRLGYQTRNLRCAKLVPAITALS